MCLGAPARVFASSFRHDEEARRRREDGGESNKTEKDDDDQRSTSQVSNSFTGSSLNVALPCPFASSTRTRLIHPWLSTTTAGNAVSRLLSEMWIRITPRKVEVRSGRTTKSIAVAVSRRDSTVLLMCTHRYALCGPSRNSFMSGRQPDGTLSWQFVDNFRDADVCQLNRLSK